MPAVSIIITTFDRFDYLRQAMESALAQTFSDFELLVCDDGGYEQTRLLCESFGDARIRHLVNRPALGAAMNTYGGIRAATADCIALLNDDDRWTPDFLERCVPALFTDEQVALVFSDHWIMDAQGSRLLADTDTATRVFGRDVLAAGYVEEPQRLLIKNSISLAMASVFRKSAVDWSLYSPEIRGAYDYFLSYCLLRSGKKVVYVPERLTEYRVHTGSSSANSHLSNSLGRAYINGLILRDPHFAAIRSHIRDDCFRGEIHVGGQYIRSGNPIPALKHFSKAVRYQIGL